MSGEGGLQEKEYLAKYGADRVRTVSTVWMGSTLGCAECHDHKFDPFKAKDFYAMKAFFADINEPGMARDGNGRNGPEAWGVKLMMPTPDEKRRLEDLDRRIAEARKALADRTAALGEQRERWARAALDRFNRGELTWRFQRPVSVSAQAATMTVHDDLGVRVGSLLRFKEKPVTSLIVAGGANPDTETYTITLKPGAGTWRSLGIEVARDDTLPGAFVARGGIGAEVSEIEATVGGAPAALCDRGVRGRVRQRRDVAGERHRRRSQDGVELRRFRHVGVESVCRVSARGTADHVVRYDDRDPDPPAVAGAACDARTIPPRVVGGPRVGRRRDRGRHGGRQRGRRVEGVPWSSRSSRADAGGARRRSSACRRAGGGGRGRNAPDAQTVQQAYFQLSSPDLAPLASAHARLEAAKAAIEMGVTRVMVSEAMPTPRETRILPRGNWMDDSGAVVEPAIPGFMGELNTGGRRATRLDLANWLVSAQNPLTARAYVNRIWHQFFGTGLSNTLADLGSQGEWPSHLALLDWLAAEFMAPQYDAAGAHAWDMKHLVRTIVTSETYKQSSAPRPDLEARDPANRLLARQVPLRVDAEVVHDVALQVSGLLAERFGGPSVRPYQPDGYLAALNYPRRSYSADRGDDLYRRALYIHWQRTFLHPSLAVFDAPSREECVLERVVSDTPLQALDLLNDPIYVEAARVFAEGALKQGGPTVSRQLDWIFSRALGRAPEPEELRTLSKLHAGSLARFQKNPGEARKLIRTGEYPVPANISPVSLAAMTTVTRVVLNLHELITRNWNLK